MTKVALSILLLLSAFSLAAPNPDEYSINVHVISSHWIMEPSIGTGPEAFQKLDAMIDGSETEKKPCPGKVQRQDFPTSLENPGTASGFSLFPPPRLRRSFSTNPLKNFAPGAPRNDDLQLGRRPVSPVWCFSRRSECTPASSPSGLPFFIAPPPQSSTRVADISPRKRHQTLVPGDRLPWLAAEPPDHDSAGSRAIDRHPRTSAAADGAQSR